VAECRHNSYIYWCFNQKKQLLCWW